MIYLYHLKKIIVLRDVVFEETIKLKYNKPTNSNSININIEQ